MHNQGCGPFWNHKTPTVNPNIEPATAKLVAPCKLGRGRQKIVRAISPNFMTAETGSADLYARLYIQKLPSFPSLWERPDFEISEFRALVQFEPAAPISDLMSK